MSGAPGLAEGHNVLVTGASSGIGRAAAQLFSQEGARVAVVDSNADGGNETVESITKEGREAIFVQADVSDEASVQAAIGEIVGAFGRLDSAFNNAGIADMAMSFHELPIENWNRMIAVNLTGVFLCTKHEIAQMLEQERSGDRRGAIVCTSSGAGFIAAPGMPHYTAAKHGVLGLIKNAAQEYYDHGIRVNAICPGVTETPMTSRAFKGDAAFVAQMKASQPGGVMGRAEDVAQAAVWLCSERARWINGEPMLVDGGSVAR